MKRGILSRTAPLAIAAGLLALLAGCSGGGPTTSGGMSQVTLHIGGDPSTGASVSRVPGVAPRAVPSNVARVDFTISGAGMETIFRSVSTAGLTEVVETFSVPKGLQRTFLVEAFDNGSLLRYRSEEVYDLLAESVSLSIAMNVAMPNDGLRNWTLVAGPDEAPAVSGIAFGGGSFVAVDTSGGIASSPTGDIDSWLNRTPDTSYFYSLADVAYGGGFFVAVGPHHRTGISALIDVPTVFVAAQDNLDGWTLAVAGIVDNTTDLEAVAYGNGTFVAVGGNGSVYYWDTLAQGWNAGTLPFSIEGSLTDVAYGNGTFVAVGGNGIFTSTDRGRTWTSRELFPDEGGSLEQVVYANGVFVGLIFDEVYFSTDGGATWTAEENLLPSLDTNFYLTTGGGVVVIVSFSGDILLPSGAMDDPATAWTTLPVDTVPGVPETFGSGLRSGTAGNGRYVVGGSDYVILRSDPL